MIKGCQKKIIHLKNTNSPYFEEAYFILKDIPESTSCKNDMIKEAERIAQCANLSKSVPNSKNILKRAALILMGAAAASLIFGIVLLIAAVAA